METPAINNIILKHELSTDSWEHNELIKNLEPWIERFNVDFKLQIPSPCLLVEKIRSRAFGDYRNGFNGLGTRYQIRLNSKHLDRSFADILRTLLHEQLHLWQEIYGTPSKKGSYHNREFRDKSYSLGIPHHATKGSLGILKGYPFETLLKKHGIDLPESPPPENMKRGKSKLAKWSCGCQSVRVGAKEFFAQCTRCHSNFIIC